MVAETSNRDFWKRTALIALAVSVVIAAINWRFYFATPFHEQGDIAANAMQIHQAKHGTEIYGNYSRYYFNHPGPAFFYVYALGERVLRDWLGVVPSAHNAHSLAGLLLQSFFFGAALAIFAERFKSPLFVPIALLLACAHFGAAHNAFTSVWPPHVLLMPFLCFFTASVSVASGRGGHLPLAALAGSFLVHGHVAQPLFVVVLFSLAYGCLWLETRLDPAPASPWKRFRASHIAAGVIVAIFLIPIVIDLSRWPNDNLSFILNQLSGNATEHKSIWKAVLYFLTFFSYPADNIVLIPEHGPATAHFLVVHAHWYLVWLAVFGFVAWAWRRLGIDNGPEGRRFLANLALFWIAAVLLCIAWAVLQSGTMDTFNSYFCYALLYVPLLLAAAAMADRPRVMLCVFVAGAIFSAGRAFVITLPNRNESGIPILEAGQAVLRADPKPDAPKILVFSHDDWPSAIAVGLMLDRAGVPFSVDPLNGANGLMFGREHSLSEPYIPDPGHPPSIWRFLRRAPPGVGVSFIGDLRVSFAPGRLDPAKGTVDFTADGNLEQFVLAGFTTPDSTDPAESILPESELDIASSRAVQDVSLELVACPHLMPPAVSAQTMELWINGDLVGKAVLDRQLAPGSTDAKPVFLWQSVLFRIPATIWNRSPVVRVVMRFPASRSPISLGINNDHRILGWRIRSLSLSYAP